MTARRSARRWSLRRWPRMHATTGPKDRRPCPTPIAKTIAASAGTPFYAPSTHWLRADYTCNSRAVMPAARGVLTLHLSRFRLPVPGPRGDAAVAELIFLHLAVLGCRQFIDKFDETWHGEAGQARCAELGQAALGQCASGAAYHRCHDLILGQFGWHGKHRSVADLRMAEQHLLDLEGRNILAAATDRVLHAIDKTEIAV